MGCDHSVRHIRRWTPEKKEAVAAVQLDVVAGGAFDSVPLFGPVSVVGAAALAAAVEIWFDFLPLGGREGGRKGVCMREQASERARERERERERERLN